MTELTACQNPDILRIIYFIKILINIVKTIIPIALIILISIDFSKGIISGEKEFGEILKTNTNKLISAILIFTIPTIINIVLEIINVENSYLACWTNANESTIEKLQALEDQKEQSQNNTGNNTGNNSSNNTGNNTGNNSSNNTGNNTGNSSNNNYNNITFSKNITFAYNYIENDNYLPYALYTPSTAKTSKKIPLIVWLHGLGDGSNRQTKIESRGLPGAISTWNLTNFNAYVVCPQIIYKDAMSWFSTTGKDSVDKIVSMMINNYNIDTNKIIIAGHSNGGKGALYQAARDTNNYYSAVVSISGNHPGVSIEPLKNMPGRSYAGSTAKGDYKSNIDYAKTSLAGVFGKENIFFLESNHEKVSIESFLLDENNNSRSDLIEWMLKQ